MRAAHYKFITRATSATDIYFRPRSIFVCSVSPRIPNWALEGEVTICLTEPSCGLVSRWTSRKRPERKLVGSQASVKIQIVSMIQRPILDRKLTISLLFPNDSFHLLQIVRKAAPFFMKRKKVAHHHACSLD